MTVTNVYRGWDGNGSFSSWIYRMLSELELVKSQDLMRPIIRSPHRKNVIKFSIFTRANAFYDKRARGSGYWQVIHFASLFFVSKRLSKSKIIYHSY